MESYNRYTLLGNVYLAVLWGFLSFIVFSQHPLSNFSKFSYGLHARSYFSKFSFRSLYSFKFQQVFFSIFILVHLSASFLFELHTISNSSKFFIRSSYSFKFQKVLSSILACKVTSNRLSPAGRCLYGWCFIKFSQVRVSAGSPRRPFGNRVFKCCKLCLLSLE